jgi:phosphoribosylformylglycinamidine (FGAM) synthase-like amidotransferase family enzyme
MPDDEQPAHDGPGGGALAALRPQQVRAIRSAAGDGRGHVLTVAVLRRYGLIPVVTAHGEGFAEFHDPAALAAAQPLVALRFVDNRGTPTEVYPYNANGSPQGITGLTTADGRFTILMPHPERVHRSVQMSWHPADWGDASPWMRMFRNARVALG